ncbi:phage tail protein [Sorangium sp. So ce341]|uniref:phage tail protein n=1 Tax=Sorangium sp. So ce341 TaxID=3133302 RepID=UPI003F6298C4
MAQSTDILRTSYPLAANNFRVKVGEASMSFTEVSGLAVAREHVTYEHGLSFQEGPAIMTFNSKRFTPVTCKRGTVLRADPLFLFNWLEKRDSRSMEVSLCDATGAAVLAWKVAVAIPVSLKAPAFSATTNDAVVDTLDLQVREVSVVRL